MIVCITLSYKYEFWHIKLDKILVKSVYLKFHLENGNSIDPYYKFCFGDFLKI